MRVRVCIASHAKGDQHIIDKTYCVANNITIFFSPFSTRQNGDIDINNVLIAGSHALGGDVRACRYAHDEVRRQ